MSNLKNCPDCGRKVSIKAASCPSCGRVELTETLATSNVEKGLIILFGFFVIVGILNSLATTPTPLESQFADFAEQAKLRSSRIGGSIG